MTVDDGNGCGSGTNQLNSPYELDIDDDNQSIVIADCGDHCIVEWKMGENNKKVVADSRGLENRLD